MPPKKHTTGEAARLLDISFITLKRWIYAGRIRAEKDTNGYWLIDEEEIQRINRERGVSSNALDRKIIALIQTRRVVYLRELQVCLEEEYLHKETYDAVKQLVPSQVQTREEWGNRWYFPSSEQWANVESIARQKNELMLAYVNHPRPFENDSISYADYSEYLVERAMLHAGYTIFAKDAYYFNGNIYRPNTSAGRPPDIDFIAKAPTMDQFLGIQVKNKMEHPKLEEVQQLLDICLKLKLRPVLVARIFHTKTYDTMKYSKGLAIKCKRYFLKPPFPRDTFHALDAMGIPIGVYLRPPSFLIQSFINLPENITH